MLLTRLETLGLTYIEDLNSDDRIFLEHPVYGILAKYSAQ